MSQADIDRENHGVYCGVWPGTTDDIEPQCRGMDDSALFTLMECPTPSMPRCDPDGHGGYTLVRYGCCCHTVPGDPWGCAADAGL